MTVRANCKIPARPASTVRNCCGPGTRDGVLCDRPVVRLFSDGIELQCEERWMMLHAPRTFFSRQNAGVKPLSLTSRLSVGSLGTLRLASALFRAGPGFAERS